MTPRPRSFIAPTLVVLVAGFSATRTFAQTQLANATILIVRHAEKPPAGASLTPDGFARAQAYARFFAPFHLNGSAFTIDALYAGQDTKNSIRPRLTLEPLSQTLHLPLDTSFPTEDPEGLAEHLRSASHGGHILIAWRHKKIPALIKALGGDPSQLIPAGTWPDDVYDWIILLRYDGAGKVEHEELIHEPQLLPH